jgi:hypothetical protein
VSARVESGWILGSLPGPEGSEYTVEHVKRTSPAPRTLLRKPPNLALHTTETDGLGNMPAEHDFPPNAWVGDHRIVQCYQVDQGGHSTDEQDSFFFQIEIVGRSQTGRWLPADSSLYPLVALVAFLHDNKLVATALKRPPRLREVPTVIDRLPAAEDTYYRRGPVQAPGVYGHVDCAGDEHWDPGGFDYPAFFGLVSDVLEGGEMGFKDFSEAAAKRWNALLAGEAKPESGRKIPEDPRRRDSALGRRFADSMFAALKGSR